MNQHTVYQITAVSDPYPGELGGRSYLSRIEAENALRRYDVGCQRIAEHECADPADSLEALYRAMRLNHPATVDSDNQWRCDLPTFGGEHPADRCEGDEASEYARPGENRLSERHGT